MVFSDFDDALLFKQTLDFLSGYTQLVPSLSSKVGIACDCYPEVFGEFKKAFLSQMRVEFDLEDCRLVACVFHDVGKQTTRDIAARKGKKSLGIHTTIEETVGPDTNVFSDTVVDELFHSFPGFLEWDII